MANESAVSNISELKTTETCAGCGQEINLLMPYLRVAISPTRSVIETVDAALVGAETDDEGNIVALSVDVTDPDAEGREMFYVGTKGGAVHSGFFHNYAHLADWVEKFIDDPEFQAESGHPTIKRLDVDPEAAGRSNE